MIIKRIIQKSQIKNYEANKQYNAMLKEMKEHKHIKYQENNEQKKQNLDENWYNVTRCHFI